jgi:pimeloyl-ACP methyl ester carboxylesterase
MTRNLYALLVGIDEYVSPVPSLNGCVNDIRAVKEYLEGRVASEGYQLHLRTLLNKNATRVAIADGFRQHLCQATSKDVAFFYYAGHGSQEQAPQEFWSFEPDRLNETLVCYDSRTPDGWDLADKELAKLIAEVARENPHITIILDCCHSGSGTRGDLELETAVRQAPIDKRKRPLESYLFSLAEAEQLSTSRSLAENPTGWKLSTGKHILISACRDIETAKEYNGDGQPRGAFSYFLLDTLKKANGTLTYRDLFKRTHALVRSKVTDQAPQIDATMSSDLDQPFLGGATRDRDPYFTISYDKDREWVIDGGAVHGIPQPSGEETTELALFPFDSSLEQLRQLSNAIASASVIEVLPQLSQVKISGIEDLNPAMTFKAVVTSLPLPPKGVWIEGEEAGIELARAALLAASPRQQPSLYIREATSFADAEWKLIACNQQYLITRPADDRPLVAPISDYTPATALQAIQRLEHLARWTNIAELASPAASRIRPDAVKMTIYRDGQELQDAAEIRLEYARENGKWRSPTFKVKLENTSNESLYCALLDLSDRYAVSASLLPTGGIWLKPGEEAWALGGDPIYPTVPQKLWTQGVTEVRDILKLIVSTAEFDATLLEQEELDLPFTPKRAVGKRQGTLNRLMSRVQSRALRAQPEEEEYDDWVASQISITTVRPQETTPIQSDRSISLGAGVELQSHPNLNAKARLTTVTQSTRDLGNHTLPPILRADREGIKPFQFTSSRGTDPGLSALELSQVEDPSVVTPQDPLKLVVDTPLKPNEQLLSVGYDGEFFLPLGRGYRSSEGQTEIVLERLPEPLSEGSRSLGGSIRIFFQKITTQQLGLDFKYPILAVADVSPDETVTYTAEIARVKARVAQAKRIVLYIHGIIGDTQSMVGSVQRAKLTDLYDLVLAFDYENLNTSIEENARFLKQRLEAVGLGADSGKELHIVAHSMGGLVSRWFIEREGGDRMVKHLIMLGTPNAGSPWSTVQDWALTALGIGLNGLSEITWPVPVLGMLVKAVNKTAAVVEKIDISLDQMHPESEFLKNLAANPDPRIPYTIIAGNTSIVPAALVPESSLKSSPIERLTQKLFNKVVALPFFGQANDIAVTVTSIKSVSTARSPQPQIQEVGCDHLVYFTNPDGLAALATAANRALGKTSPPATVSIPVSTDAVKTSTPVKKQNFNWFIGGAIAILLIVSAIGLVALSQSNNTQPNFPTINSK